MNGYRGFHTYRSTCVGGGVSVFCSNSLKAQKIDQLSLNNEEIETCTVQIDLNPKCVVILAIYRPPQASLENFILSIDSILTNDFLRNKIILIAGDLNINLDLIESNSTQNYLNCLNSYHFISLINIPTRPNNLSENSLSSNLDHIWVNGIMGCSSGVLKYDVTDHYPTFAFISLPTQLNQSQESYNNVTIRPHTEENFDVLCTKLGDFQWDSILDEMNVSLSFEAFFETLNKIYCECYPKKVKQFSLKRSTKPWLTREILNLIKQKEYYYRQFRLGYISRTVNNSFKNKVNKEINKAKNYYYLNCFDNAKGDMKKSWKLIRDLSGYNAKSKSQKLAAGEGGSIMDQANRFNAFFSSIGEVLSANISGFNDSLSMEYRNPRTFFLAPVSASEIDRIITNLKLVKTNLDQMPVKIFILVRHLLLYPLVKLINMCFRKGVYPDQLKLARIVPIYKGKGETDDPTNYRPISCLPYIGKVFERCLTNRIINFCDKFSLFSNNQFGFQSGKSTCDALIHLTEIIYNSLDKKEHNITILIDLQKAFDTISHQILLKKLERYGFRGVPLKLVSSYLSNRRSYVQLNSVVSSECVITTGLPQGSIISPILFLLFINDMPKFSDKFNTTLFADDTTLTMSNSNFTNLVGNCNNELNNLVTWTKMNKLCINVGKTELLIISNRTKEDLSIHLDNNELTCVKTCKFLGIHLDDKLSFENHVKFVISKISRHTGILYRIRDKLPMKARLDYYYGLIYPYLSYNVVVWGSTYGTWLNPLIVQHKRLIRILCNASPYDHTTPLFLKHRLLKFDDIFRYNICLKMFNMKDQFKVSHTRETRHRDLAAPVFHRLTLSQHAFSFSGPSQWNALPLSLRSIGKLHLFKRALKSFLLAQYEEHE